LTITNSNKEGGEVKMPVNYKAYIDAKKNRIVGAILHAVDSNAPINELKALIKSRMNAFAKDMADLCNAIERVDIEVNPLGEIYKKQVEKASAKISKGK